MDAAMDERPAVEGRPAIPRDPVRAPLLTGRGPEDRPGVAIIANSHTPYRLHLHRRIAAELAEVWLWSLYTHEQSNATSSIRPVTTSIQSAGSGTAFTVANAGSVATAGAMPATRLICAAWNDR